MFEGGERVGVTYDWCVVVHFGEKVSKGNILSGRDAGIRRGLDQRVPRLRGGINDYVHVGVKGLVDRVVGLGGGVECCGVLRGIGKVGHGGGGVNRSMTV